MKRVLFFAVGAVLALSTLPASASWPRLACGISKVRPGGSEESAFKALITSRRHVTVFGTQFYSIEISEPDDSNWITCDFEISVSEEIEWSSLEYKRTEGVGLLPPLENANPQRSGELKNLTTMLATVESLGLKSSYCNSRISSNDGKKTYGVSNSLRVLVKSEDVEKLHRLALIYMKTLGADVRMSVYQDSKS